MNAHPFFAASKSEYGVRQHIINRSLVPQARIQAEFLQGPQTCMPYSPLKPLDLKHLPPNSQQVYKLIDRACFLSGATAHGRKAISDNCSYKAQQRTFLLQWMFQGMFPYCSTRSDGSYSQPMLVGTKMGKLEVNSLTMGTPPGLWGICSRHAQLTQH